jgi:hypothetical protein
VKKAITAAVVALGPIALFVVTPVFMAAPANACEGGPAAVRLCQLACSMGATDPSCPPPGAQPAGPPQQASAAPAAQPPPPAVAPPPPPAAHPTTPPEAPTPPPVQPPAAPEPAAGGMSPGAVATWPGGVAADCGNAVYAAHYNFFCATAPGAPQIRNNPYPPGVPLNTPDTVPDARPAAPNAPPPLNSDGQQILNGMQDAPPIDPNAPQEAQNGASDASPDAVGGQYHGEPAVDGQTVGNAWYTANCPTKIPGGCWVTLGNKVVDDPRAPAPAAASYTPPTPPPAMQGPCPSGQPVQANGLCTPPMQGPCPSGAVVDDDGSCPRPPPTPAATSTVTPTHAFPTTVADTPTTHPIWSNNMRPGDLQILGTNGQPMPAGQVPNAGN